MKKKLWMAGTVLGVLGIALAARPWSRPSTRDLPTTYVHKGPLQIDIHTTGEMRTPHSSTLAAPSVSGSLQIVRIVKTGAEVKAGEVVVEFDPTEQEYNLDQSRSRLAEADQQIIQAKADAEVKAAADKVALLKARFDVRRAELDVSKNELASAIDAQKNLLALEEARRRLEQLGQDENSRNASSAAALFLLEEKRRTALLGMRQAQEAIDRMKLTSPMDGLISIQDNVDSISGFYFAGMTLPEYRAGDVVIPGRLLAEVLDAGKMEVMAKVFENDRSNLNVGQAAEVRMDAQPQVAIPARVKTISGMASKSDFSLQSVPRFDMALELAGAPGAARPGSTAQIVVRGSPAQDQLYLPSQCLFEKDGKLVVYVKHGSRFEALEPKVKFRTEDRIAIENLPEGAEVALVNPEERLRQDKGSSASPLASSPLGVEP